MPGLLDTFFGNADQTQAMGLLGATMASGQGFGQGAGLAMQHLAGAPQRRRQGLLEELQIQEAQGSIEAQRLKTQLEQAELERQRRIQEALPRLFRQPGMTGGQAVPQTEGGIPMFSRPPGVTPMQQTPGGFDVQEAIRLGMKPEQITAFAGLQNLGRPKATRQIEVDDGRGGKRIALVDDFGNEVANFNGFTAPVQVNQGDRISFIRPAPGVSLPIGMSPDSRASNALGWANHGVSRQRLALDASNAQAGKAPAGYRFKPDGSLEAIPGGPADIKAGEQGEKARLRQQSTVTQANSVLKEIRDAKGLVSWNTAGVGGTLSVLPSTEARDLSAKLQTVKANLGFDRLQQMRDQSPTGGALGQVAVQELASLQATVASLDQLQSPAQLGVALDKIEQHYTNWLNVVNQASNPQGGATGGWEIREKK